MYEIAGTLGTIAGFALGIVFLFNRFNSEKKAVETPTGNCLVQGETKIGELYTDVGRLILTPQRFLVSSVNEKVSWLTLKPQDISSIKIGRKGVFIDTPTLTIHYTDRKNKSKRKTWNIPKKIKVGFLGIFPGIYIMSKTYENPHSVTTFKELLLNWKEQAK